MPGSLLGVYVFLLGQAGRCRNLRTSGTAATSGSQSSARDSPDWRRDGNSSNPGTKSSFSRHNFILADGCTPFAKDSPTISTPKLAPDEFPIPTMSRWNG